MKKIPLILTLLLTVAWGYTSWYWYTCNIKGFCDGATPQTLVSENKDSSFVEVSSDSGTIQTSSAEKLSATDVLSESAFKESNIAVESASGVTDTTANNENLVKETEVVTPNLPAASEKTICSGTFIGPVAVGGTNNQEQVELLETFLLSQGESVTVDGSYDTGDIEAVKRFQLKYKEDILDPWDITAPTGYVYTTTIKKMKEIGCQ